MPFSRDETRLSLLYTSLLVAVRCQTAHHLSTHRHQILPMSRLFSLVSVIFRCEPIVHASVRIRFKCANSLTVHRRRLHLLPLGDKLNDDNELDDNANARAQVSHRTIRPSSTRSLLAAAQIRLSSLRTSISPWQETHLSSAQSSSTRQSRGLYALKVRTGPPYDSDILCVL